jgi:hypothetical protein
MMAKLRRVIRVHVARGGDEVTVQAEGVGLAEVVAAALRAWEVTAAPAGVARPVGFSAGQVLHQVQPPLVELARVEDAGVTGEFR